jgi:hypothetical protein
MSENKKSFELKLSPAASVIVVVGLLIAGGAVYMVKPELFEGVLDFKRMEVLTEEKYLSAIEEDLNLYLRSAVVQKLIAEGASQTDFNALGAIEIVSIKADPVDYFANERAFWMSRESRRVRFETRFKVGGESYSGQGEFRVDGIANRISFTNAELVE